MLIFSLLDLHAPVASLFNATILGKMTTTEGSEGTEREWGKGEGGRRSIAAANPIRRFPVPSSVPSLPPEHINTINHKSL